MPMSPLFLLGLLLCAAIGVSLGLLGGGGSIITLPVLVYALGVEPRSAVGMSLAVVGATSLVGTVLHARRGALRPRTGLTFAAAGVPTALAGARLTHLLAPQALLLAFAALMLVVAAVLLTRRRRGPEEPTGDGGHRPRPGREIAAGAGVGFLTGFLGVGGGFLILPALVVFGGLPMHQAVGTSLLVIAVNCAAGLVGHLTAGGFAPGLTAAVTALAVAGSFAGTALAHRVPASRLRRGFAWLVAGVGLWLAAANLPALWR